MDEDTGLLRASLAYPFRGEEWRSRLVLGAGLNLLAGVVLAAATGLAAVATGAVPAPLAGVVALAGLIGYVPLLGYLAAVIRELLSGEDDPPPFGALDELAADGVRLAAVVAGYALPAVLLVAAGLALGGAPGTAVGALGVAAALAAAYLLPVALVRVVEEGAAGAALERAPLRSGALDGAYARAWIVAAALFAVGGTAGAVLAPVVAGFVVLFVAQVAAVHAGARGAAAALGLVVEEPPAPPASGYVPGWDDEARRKELTEGLGGALLPETAGGSEDDLERAGGPGTGDLASAGAGEAGSDLEAYAGRNGDGTTDVEAADGDGTTDIETADGDGSTDIEAAEDPDGDD